MGRFGFFRLPVGVDSPGGRGAAESARGGRASDVVPRTGAVKLRQSGRRIGRRRRRRCAREPLHGAGRANPCSVAATSLCGIHGSEPGAAGRPLGSTVQPLPGRPLYAPRQRFPATSEAAEQRRPPGRRRRTDAPSAELVTSSGVRALRLRRSIYITPKAHMPSTRAPRRRSRTHLARRVWQRRSARQTVDRKQGCATTRPFERQSRYRLHRAAILQRCALDLIVDLVEVPAARFQTRFGPPGSTMAIPGRRNAIVASCSNDSAILAFSIARKKL